jgi:hypothetical protein
MGGIFRIPVWSWSIETLHAELLTNLVLDQELDTLDGGSSGLGDSGGDTTHWKSVSIEECDGVE